MTKLGCLIIHGFSGGLEDLKPLSQFLNTNGYITYCPLLKGHGGSKKEFASSTYRQWIASAQEGYDRLSTMCDKIIVIGFSMGGLVAVNLLSNKNIEALITLSSPVKFWDYKIICENILEDIKNRRIDKSKPYITWFIKVPISACINFLILLKKTKHLFSKVNIPCLVIQGKKDDTTRWMSAQYIFNNIASEKKVLKYYKDAPHLICNYKKSDIVFNDILDFIKNLEKPSIVNIDAG